MKASCRNIMCIGCALLISDDAGRAGGGRKFPPVATGGKARLRAERQEGSHNRGNVEEDPNYK
jgi:hypothetical protein